MERSCPLSLRSRSNLAPPASIHRRFLLAGAVVALVLLAPGPGLVAQENPAAVNALWVAESSGVIKVATADGSLVLEIPGFTNVRAVAVDHHRPTLWLYAGQNLYAYGYDGTQQLAVPLALPNPANAALAVDEHDGSIWLGADQNLVSVSASGQVLQSLRLADNVKSLAVDAAGALVWVGTASSAAAYDAVAGTLVAFLDLGANPDLRDLDLDPAGKVWVALGGAVRRYAADGTLLLAVPLNSPLHVAGDGHGGAWVTTGKNLLQVNPAGQVSAPLSPFGGQGTIVEVVLDPSNGDAWVANDSAVAQVDAAGLLVRAFQFQPPVHIWDLALYADVIPPQLAITAPTDGSYLNRKTPAITVTYSDVGSGVDPATLAFTANGSPLQVSCSTTSTGASCAVANPFPEGPEAVTATVKDYAGNTSQAATVAFTIDTIPPAVTITSPASGLLTNQRQLTVAGSVSEAATVTLNGAPVAVASNLTFAPPITLQEGPNAVVVVATDRAGNQGQASLQVTLDTTPPAAVAPQAVTVTAPAGGSSTVSAGPGSAEPAAAVLLTDVTTGATAATSVAADGSFSATIACQAGDSIQIVLRDAAGNSSAPATVTVPGAAGNGLPPDPSTVATPIDRTVVTDIAAATAFLYTGSNPIQQGVRPGAVDPFIVAVLRGSVHDRSGQPVPGVTVTVLGHPELGSTLTRADGAFDLAANGGGLVTVQFDKSGFLTAQRQVNAPWRDYVWLDDVVLVQTDAAATFVDTSLTTPQVIRGTAVQDQDGSRQAMLLFPAGTGAQLVLPGGQTQPLPTLTVRATEYTVGASGPKAMPAPLPPTSAYTYAVELGADEATASGSTVQFSQPLPFYLENFLNFPVGGIVPAGYYDRTKAAWIASENGLVVKILSVTGGLADLDVAGAGSPASPAALAALGITSGERQSLAALYPAGQTLWRVPIRHFSSWDFNWPVEAPPQDLAPPNPDGAPPPDLPDPCEESGASSISCENQTLGEDVPIVGTPFTLHYQGDRVPGRLDPRSLQITLSGPNPPASLVRIDLSVSIAGRQFQQSFAPGPNLSTSFAWDGVDAYGRLLQGEFPATVTVTSVINGQYAPPPAGLPLAFGEPPSAVNVGLTPARYVFTFSRTYTRSIGFINATAEKLGGWMLNVHHVYDPATRTVWRGDGTRENADPIGTDEIDNMLDPFAVTVPNSLELLADGSVDSVSSGEIDHVDRNGGVQLQYSGFTSESYFIQGAARDKFNRLFFHTCFGSEPGVNGWNTEIRTVLDPFDSQALFSLPLVPCTASGGIQDFVSDDAGGFYLAAGLCQSIFCAPYPSLLHVRSGGSVATLIDANVMPTFSASSVAVGPEGSLFVGDALGGRVLRLDPTGKVTVVAGTGTRGFSGDGGPAVAAQLIGPVGISVGADGSLWVTDDGRLRHIDVSGIIRTVAGGGAYPGEPGVGVSPFAVSFKRKVSVDPNGVLYYGDPFYSSFFLGVYGVWRIGDPFPGFSSHGFVVASEDASEVYEFSAEGRHLRTLDPVTGAAVYSFTYDGANLLIAIQDRDGRLTRIQRDPQGNATAIVSPDGQTTTLATGPDGYLQTVTDPAAEAVSFTYAAGGLMATQKDPRGFQSTYQYAGDGRLVLDTDAAGGFKSFQRAAGPGFESVTMTTGAGDSSQFGLQYPAGGGRLRLFTGPDGSTVHSEIAPNGQQTESWPDGSVVTTTLGPDPRFGLQSPIVTSEQIRMPSGLTMSTGRSRSAVLGVAGDPLSLTNLIESWTMNGQVFTETFDRSQMRWSFQAPSGRTATATTSAAGRPTSLQVGNLDPVQLTYDTGGRITSAIQGSGLAQRTMNFVYRPDGRLGSFTDPLKRTFSFTWDTAGDLASRTFADGRSVSFTYDADRNLTSVTPPGRSPRAFTFTPVDLQQSYTPPKVGSDPTNTTYSYDLDRRLTGIHRPDGSAITLTYLHSRLASINTSEGMLSFTYDPTSSLLQSVSSPSGEGLAYTYDGTLLTKTTWSGPVQGTLGRNSNQDFQLSSQSVNGQPPVGFLYDSDGLMIQAGGLSLSRDAVTGLVTATSLGSVTTSQAYNSFGELSTVSASYAGSEIFRNDFTRDVGGRIASKVETISGSASSYAYTYDGAGRLTDVAKDGAPLSHYGYDSNSNRSSTAEGSTTTTSDFDAQDRLVSGGSFTYTYSVNGDLASKSQNGSTVAYAYDSLGNLVTVIDASGVRTDYIIDGEYRRVGKKVDNVLVQAFLWQGRLRVAAELDGAGNLVSTFVYGTGFNVPDYMVNNGGTYRILTDHLGSPRLVVDTVTGAVAQRIDYDTWGRVILDTNPGFQPFGFAGGLYDYRTGLVRFGARDYDPEVGRWTAHEPLLLSASNLYEYAADDPINLYDPEGSAPKPPPPPGGYPPILGPLGPNGQPKGVPPELGPWQWSPDPNNRRGGKWYRPGRGNGGKFCSWDPDDQRHGRPHWDVNDGQGHRDRWDENGNPVHNDPPSKLPPDPAPIPWWQDLIPPWGSIYFPIIEPCLIMPFSPGCGSSVGGSGEV
jgi:RHS repeat-associated protein